MNCKLKLTIIQQSWQKKQNDTENKKIYQKVLNRAPKKIQQQLYLGKTKFSRSELGKNKLLQARSFALFAQN